MEQRNTLCTHQMLDLQPVQGLSHHHRDQYVFPGNLADYANLYTNQTIQPVLTAAANASDLGLQFKDYHDSSMFYGNHYNSSHNLHPLQNLGPAAPATSNFVYPSMVPTSSNRNFPIPWNNESIDCLPLPYNQRDTGITMDEFGRNNQSINTRVSSKRKNAEAPEENHFNMIGISSSSSPHLFFPSNSLLPQLESYVLGSSLVDATKIAPPEYQGREIIQNTEGSHRSSGCRSSAIGLQPGSASFPHHNYVLRGIQRGQPLQVDHSMWSPQFHIGNYIGHGACSSWNYADPSLHGSCLGSGGFEMNNMGIHAYNSASSCSNSIVLFNPTSMPDVDQRLPPIQTVQVQSYGLCAQLQAHSYKNPLNLHPVNVYPSRDAPESGSTLVRPSNNEQIYMPWQVHHAAPVSHGSLRLLSAQETKAMEMAEVYGSGNEIDHHQDMRLDIDEMPYEELLALEEQIGDVKTGLTEEYIRKNLKTTVHNLQLEPLSAEQSQENECCIICQVEYKQDGIIGTLDCGHHYHDKCIKQWLLLKNLCPICKSTALGVPENEG